MLTIMLTIKFKNIPIITVVSENFRVYNVWPNFKTPFKKHDTMNQWEIFGKFFSGEVQKEFWQTSGNSMRDC